LVHDRRNCGASDVSIDGKESEYEIWADDLHALLAELGALPVIAGGGSSGCRLSLLLALRYPKDVRALLLWRVTGGRFACERLAEQYYGQYIKQAKAGGMATVCATEHWADRIKDRPSNRDYLMNMDVARFIQVMEHWRTYFLAGADLPVIGCTEAQLKSVAVPTLIIPGNDRTHGHAVGNAAHRLIPKSELVDLFPGDVDIDIVEMEEWQKREADMAKILLDFLERRVR
ncbi:MAG: alpha/beta hydrolase, partial [Alphaproteobacteria bacterium]|nr:alpha/beta hydrolase [Alphaproteobacteria bacterium]